MKKTSLHLSEGSMLLELLEKQNPDEQRELHKQFLRDTRKPTIDYTQLQQYVDTPGFDFNYRQTFLLEKETIQTSPLFLMLLDALITYQDLDKAKKFLVFCLHNGADINFQSDQGHTVLFSNTAFGVDMLTLLLNHGASLNIQNLEGKNVISYKISRGEFEAAQVLLSQKKDLTLTEVQLYQHNLVQYDTMSDTIEEAEKNSLCPEIYTYDHSALSAVLLSFEEKFSLEKKISSSISYQQGRALKI